MPKTSKIKASGALSANSGNVSHNNSPLAAGTYGNGGNFPVPTIDQYGHITAMSTMAISSYDFINMYVTGVPQTATLIIASAMSQYIALPVGTYMRLTFTGSGPFYYRLGSSAAVVAAATDPIGLPGYPVVIPTQGFTYIAVYAGAGAGAVYIEGGNSSQTVYANTAALPAGASYTGQAIWITNPCVPLGKSRLWWNGTTWVAPPGEVIASVYGAAGLPVVSVIPGVLTLYEVYESPIIPDIYFANKSAGFRFNSMYTMHNPAGVAGAISGITLSGQLPTSVNEWLYAFGSIGTPSTVGIGRTSAITRWLQCDAGTNIKSDGASGDSTGVRQWTVGVYAPTTMRIYAMAKASSVTDTYKLWGYTLVAEGNL